MDILTKVALPFVIAVLAAVPGIAGLYLLAAQRKKHEAETASIHVKTALSLIAPLEERIAKQTLFIDELQAEHERAKRASAAKDAVIAELMAELEKHGGID